MPDFMPPPNRPVKKAAPSVPPLGDDSFHFTFSEPVSESEMVSLAEADRPAVPRTPEAATAALVADDNTSKELNGITVSNVGTRKAKGVTSHNTRQPSKIRTSALRILIGLSVLTVGIIATEPRLSQKLLNPRDLIAGTAHPPLISIDASVALSNQPLTQSQLSVESRNPTELSQLPVQYVEDIKPTIAEPPALAVANHQADDQADLQNTHSLQALPSPDMGPAKAASGLEGARPVREASGAVVHMLTPSSDVGRGDAATLSNDQQTPSERERLFASVPNKDDTGAMGANASVVEVVAAAAVVPLAAMPPVQSASTTARSDDGIELKMTAGQLQGLVSKSRDLIASGNIAAARSVLNSAVDTGDGTALFLLGETYDPSALARWGVIGVRPNVALARRFYERAASKGSHAASDRLAALTP